MHTRSMSDSHPVVSVVWPNSTTLASTKSWLFVENALLLELLELQGYLAHEKETPPLDHHRTLGTVLP
jgi:hypothetical protein